MTPKQKAQNEYYDASNVAQRAWNDREVVSEELVAAREEAGALIANAQARYEAANLIYEQQRQAAHRLGRLYEETEPKGFVSDLS